MNVAYICSNIINLVCEFMMRDIGAQSETLQTTIMVIIIILIRLLQYVHFYLCFQLFYLSALSIILI